MPKLKVLQNNFTTGMISPKVEARVDLAKYEGACRVIRNAIVMAQGGVTKRPGTEYIWTPSGAGDGMLFPFVYSRDQSYALLFAEVTTGGGTQNRVYFYTNEGAVMASGGSAYFIQSPYSKDELPLVKFVQTADVLYMVHPDHPPKKLVRYGHTDWAFEDVEFVPGIDAPTDIEIDVTGFSDSTSTYLPTVTEYKVAAVSMDGEESLPSDAAPASTLSTWPQGARVYLNWDPVPGAVRYEVYKNTHGWFEWAGSTEETTFTDDNIEPDSSVSPKEYRDPFHAPDVPSVTVSGSTTYEVRVSAVNSGGAESAAGVKVSGETVSIAPVNGAEIYYVYHRAAGERWKYSIVSASNSRRKLEVNNGSGTDVAAVYVRSREDDKGGKTAWKLLKSYFGSHSTIAYTDEAETAVTTSTTLWWIRWDGTSVDKAKAMSEKILSVSNPDDLSLVIAGAQSFDGEPLESSDCYPGAVGIYQQRLMFGGSHQRPQTVWLSETGSFNSMAVSKPLRDDSAITVTVDTRQVNEVRHFVAMSDAFVLTNATEFRMQGKEGTITPGNISFRPQSYWGCSHVPPLVIGTTILMVDASGRVVRDAHYNLQEDGYTGDDRSILADHLLRQPIRDWAYQQNPFSTVYIVREDGKLLTFTYMREQEIWAWAEHDSVGATYRSVCCVPEDGKDYIYFYVKRGTQYFVERQMLREYGDSSVTSWFVDCGLSLTLSGGTTTNVVSGLGYLKGQTVYGVADGSYVPPRRVAVDGTVTLDIPASEIILGLPYTMEVITVDPDIKGQDGTRFGSRKTIGPVVVDVLETAGLSIGADSNHMEVLKVLTATEWGQPVQLVTDKIKSPVPGYARDEASVRFTSNDPFPATVLAVKAEVSIE